jgi:MerR family transcriptional regulator, thiopeptide resistance regulator
MMKSMTVEDAPAREWAIRDVARATGLTSRTLRHYEQIGLLTPSRVAGTGYRYYGAAELSRLYRILSLRALGLPLPAIDSALATDEPLADSIRTQLRMVEQRRDHLINQIARLHQSLRAIENGEIMEIDEIFAGADSGQYEDEVRQRWGDDAWNQGNDRRTAMTPTERTTDDRRSADLTSELRVAAARHGDAGSTQFQELISTHYEWVTDHWGGRAPTRQEYLGLSQLYVTDVRFAAAYGGQDNAEAIRSAIQTWVESNL